MLDKGAATQKKKTPESFIDFNLLFAKMFAIPLVDEGQFLLFKPYESVDDGFFHTVVQFALPLFYAGLTAVMPVVAASAVVFSAAILLLSPALKAGWDTDFSKSLTFSFEALVYGATVAALATLVYAALVPVSAVVGTTAAITRTTATAVDAGYRFFSSKSSDKPTDTNQAVASAEDKRDDDTAGTPAPMQA